MAAPHAPTGAHDAGAEHAAAFPPFDASLFGHQLFWLAVSFVLLYFGLSRYVLPKIAQVLEARQASIGGDLAAAEQANRAARDEQTAYERALNAARAETRRVLDAARAEAAAAQARALAQSEQTVTAQIEEAEARLAKARTAGLEAVSTAAQEAADLIVAKLLPPQEALRAAGGAP